MKVPPSNSTDRLRRPKALALFGSLFSALVIFAVTPAVLWLSIGEPWAERFGSHWAPGVTTTVSGLALVAWVAWAACGLGLLRSVVDHLRAGRIDEPHGAPLAERLGARIAAGILTLCALGAPFSAPAPPADATSSVGQMPAVVALDEIAAPLDPGRADSPKRASRVLRARGPRARGLGCAALARRSRRTRLLRQLSNDPLAYTPTAVAIDTDIAVTKAADFDALAAFESANRALASRLGVPGADNPATHLSAVRVDTSGIEFWLAEPTSVAPLGFTAGHGGRTWHSSLAQNSTDAGGPPHLPIALCVGEGDGATWLVPLVPGDCLTLIGEAADALWHAARIVQEAWAWSELVVVTTDPTEVATELERSVNAASASSGFPKILYFGDPGALPLAQRRRISIVTTSIQHSAASSSDVTIMVDRRCVTIHPLGQSLRPHLIDHASIGVVADVVSATTPAGPPPRVASNDDVTHGGETAAHPGSLGPETPGAVEVKLLTATPRIDGLRQPLAQNRARRAVELVAYLALHRPDAVTSDRLRTRVLGTADADAARKTLFNIATAARHALGADDTGAPFLPCGSRSGYYQVSNAMTVDVQRAGALAALGSAKSDPEESMAYLRAALALVESEPLANALSGYTWWDAEGHGARLAAVLVNAACDLAALAVVSGYFELARWGLDQARLVEPYSEAITRASMQVAAASGDADDLRREWRECQRRMDDLDPGSSPSPRTERLYGELRQRVVTGAVRLEPSLALSTDGSSAVG